MTYEPTDGGQSSTEDTTDLSLPLVDLMMGTEYTITVVGFNDVGDGAPSTVTQATNIDCEFTRVGETVKEGRESQW